MKRTSILLALPIALSPLFNTPASANIAGYQATIQDFTAQYGTPTPIRLYNENGSFDVSQFFRTGADTGIRVDYVGHSHVKVDYKLQSVDVVDGDLYSNDYYDQMHFAAEDNSYCTDDGTVRIHYGFSISPSFNDLSHLQISPEEAQELFSAMFRENMEDALDAITAVQNPDIIDRDINSIGGIFYPVLSETLQEFENTYAISVQHRAPFNDIQRYTVRAPYQSNGQLTPNGVCRR